MAEHEISVDEIVSKNGEDINLPDFLAYETAHTAIDYEPEPTRLVEYGVVKSMVANASPLPSTPIPVTSNPFVYNSTITTYIPNFRVFLKTGSVYAPIAVDMDFDMSTGNVTVRVDYTADSYVLVIG